MATFFLALCQILSRNAPDNQEYMEVSGMEAPSAVAVQRQLFDYGELTATEVKKCEAAVDRITKCQRRMAADILAIGKELLAVKERLEHGQFGDWIKHYFGWASSTAARMMDAAKVFGEFPNLGNLTIDTSALYLLSSDKCPDETRDEFVERAEKGERITHAMVKAELDGDDKDEPTYEDRIDKIIAKIRLLAANEPQRCILIASLKNICQELEEDE